MSLKGTRRSIGTEPKKRGEKKECTVTSSSAKTKITPYNFFNIDSIIPDPDTIYTQDMKKNATQIKFLNANCIKFKQ